MVCAANASAISHRQRLRVNDVLVLPVVVKIRHKPVIRIVLLWLCFLLRHKVIIEEHAGDRNLRKCLYPLVEATKAIVANLIWIEFAAVVARSTVVANLISL